MGLSWPLFLYLHLYYILQFTINFCWCWDSNYWSLVSEATALPNVPQPLSKHVLTFTHLLHYAGVINFSILAFYVVVLPILASTSQKKLYVQVSIFCRGKRRRRLNATLICLSIIHSFQFNSKESKIWEQLFKNGWHRKSNQKEASSDEVNKLGRVGKLKSWKFMTFCWLQKNQNAALVQEYCLPNFGC